MSDTPIKFNVRIAELQAAMIFASTDETRFMLCGVHIELNHNKPPVLVSTDGRRLAVIKSEAEQLNQDVFDRSETTIASGFLKTLLPFAKAHTKNILAFEYRPPTGLSVRFIGCPYVIEAPSEALMDGVYPSWRKIVPLEKQAATPFIGIDARYVGDYAAAAKILKCKAPQIAINLRGRMQPIEIKILTHSNFYGLVMPVRSEEEPIWQPEFLGLEAAKPEIAKAETDLQPA